MPDMHDWSAPAAGGRGPYPSGTDWLGTIGSRELRDAPCIPVVMRVAKLSSRAPNIHRFIAEGLCIGLLAASVVCLRVAAAEPSEVSKPSDSSAWHEDVRSVPVTEAQSPKAHSPRRANFWNEPASDDARQVANWVIDSGDNNGQSFVIVDKREAKVFVFESEGTLRGAAAALLGLARGDNSVAGIGQRKLADIRPEERTTPPGRFVAALGNDMGKADILWVDYDAGISLHRVITTNPKEHRLDRLATATPLDNRISYGCINVPANFYNTVVQPAFTGASGIVYILPEVRSIREIFPAFYDVETL